MNIHAPGALQALWAEPFRAQPVLRQHIESKGSGFLRRTPDGRPCTRGTRSTHHWAKKNSFNPVTNPSYVAPPKPARFTHSRARALTKLVVRRGANLDSDVCGHVEAGTSVMVLEENKQIGRVYIGSDFAEGVRPLGWVTSEKSGEVYLSMEDARPPGEMLNCSPRLNPKIGRITSRPTHSQETLAQRRRGKSASSDKFLNKLVQAEQRDDMSSFVRKKRSSLGGLLGSEALIALGQAQVDRASDKEDGPNLETFSSRVGRIMIAGGHQAGDLATAWDRNKHNAVTKFDFCVGLRQLLESSGKRMKEFNSKQEREEMERLFDTLDLDKSGELDLTELKTALRRLAKEAQDVDSAAQRHKEESGAQIRAVAAAYKTAAAETAELEAAEDVLANMRHGGGSGLEAKIGKVLIARNMKVGDILREWDDDNSGTIDAEELHTHLKGLGLNPSKQESQALFVEFDDGDGEVGSARPRTLGKVGTLSCLAADSAHAFALPPPVSWQLTMKELGRVLKRLQETAVKATADEKAQTRLVNEKRKVAREAQQFAERQARDMSPVQARPERNSHEE